MSNIDIDETSEDRNPRFSKALFGRIIAVLAFACLGTFAVVQSVVDKGDKDDKVASGDLNPDKNADSGSDDGDSESVTLESKSGFTSTPTSTKFASPPDNKKLGDFPKSSSTLPGGFGGSTPPVRQIKSESKRVPPVTTVAKLPTQESGPPSRSFADIPKSNSFGGIAAPRGSGKRDTFGPDPSKTTSRSTLPNQQKPPERLAQLPSGGAGGGNAFAPTRNTPLTSGPPARSTIDGTFGAAQKAATDFAADLRTKSGEAADNLKRKVTETGQGALDSLRQQTNLATNALRSQPDTATTNQKLSTNAFPSNRQTSGNVGNRKQTNDSFGSPLGPPAARNDFGAPPQRSQSPPPFNPAARQSTILDRGTAGKSPQPNDPFSTTPSTGRDTVSRNSAARNTGALNPNVRNTAPPTRNNLGFDSTPNRQTDTPPSNNDRFGAAMPARRPLSTQPAAKSFGQSSSANSVPALPVSSSRMVSNSPIRALPTPGDRKLEGIRKPSLFVQKLAPREIQLNTTAKFEIVVKNAGQVTADDVQIFDRIPQGTEFIGATPRPERASDGGLIWQLGSMRPGQEQRIQLELKPTRPGEIGSVARYTFAGQASMRTLVTKPVLTIRHTGPAKSLIGDDVLLDIVIENKGDGPATNVMLQEDVPEQLGFQDGRDRELEYVVGTLAPGQSRNIRLALKAAQIGRLKNVIFASADGELRAQHQIDMEIIAPRLSARSNGPRKRYLRREATHQFSVENKGTADATNVELVARLPRGLRFVNANNRGKYDPSTNSVYWSLESLAPGMVADVELRTMPIEPGDQPIKFESFADLDQKAETEQPLLVEHLIDVFFDIDDLVDPIEIGSSTSYRIRLVNQGTQTATNVQMLVEFPNGITPQSVDGPLTNEVRGQRVVFAPINSLEPGDEIKVTVNGKGMMAGDHRVIVRVQTDGREVNVSKEESTRVYNDR